MSKSPFMASYKSQSDRFHSARVYHPARIPKVAWLRVCFRVWWRDVSALNLISKSYNSIQPQHRFSKDFSVARSVRRWRCQGPEHLRLKISYHKHLLRKKFLRVRLLVWSTLMISGRNVNVQKMSRQQRVQDWVMGKNQSWLHSSCRANFQSVGL